MTRAVELGPEAASFIGIDLGTSGCRGVAIDAAARLLASARRPFPEPLIRPDGGVEQDPEIWWSGVQAVLRDLAAALADHPPAAICCDGTSATLLLTDAQGRPLFPARLYNDRSGTAAAAQIAAVAPAESPARGAGSSLAKLLTLAARLPDGVGPQALHQADWIAGRLTHRYGDSDWHNALKLGYDAQRLIWPDWLTALLPANVSLPRVLPPGAPIGRIDPAVAATLGLPDTVAIHAGTTDSNAAAIAAGLAAPGDALTSLGSTLVVKVLAERPVSASRWGVYSHRFGDLWLVGGASNAGGTVLRRYFTDAEISALSARIDPTQDSGLDYYPLPAPGERFPYQDPQLPPRLEPRPADPAHFLHGLLEGIARIEAAGYARLETLGAPRPTRILSVGGGAQNPVWTRLRERLLGIPVISAVASEAALGAALLARSPTPAPTTGAERD